MEIHSIALVSAYVTLGSPGRVRAFQSFGDNSARPSCITFWTNRDCSTGVQLFNTYVEEVIVQVTKTFKTGKTV